MTRRLCWSLALDEVKDKIDFLEKRGMDVEIALFDTHWGRSYSLKKVREIAHLLKEKEIGISTHGPIYDLNPGSLDDFIRQYTKRCFLRAVELNARLGSSMVVFHTGFILGLADRYHDKWLERCLDIWKEVMERAKGWGIKVAIENFYEPSPEIHRRLLEGLSSYNPLMCFDLGHFNIFSREPLESWLDTLGPFIAKVHLSDNCGQCDEHLTFGEGNVDFQGFFHQLRQRALNSVITFELSPDKIEESLQYLKREKIELPQG